MGKIFIKKAILIEIIDNVFVQETYQMNHFCMSIDKSNIFTKISSRFYILHNGKIIIIYILKVSIVLNKDKQY